MFKKRSQINHLTFHLKQLGRKEQTKSNEEETSPQTLQE